MPNIETFARQYGPAAMQAGQALGVDPSILLGQWGLETGWGKSVIPGTNNLGNIKDFSGGGVAATDNATGSRDNYRAYDTPAGFADDYVSLIQRMYPGAVGAGNDAMGFANALKSGGYAEDPAYVQKVTGTTGMVRKLGERLTDMLIPSASAAELPPDPSQAEAQPQSVGTPSTDASQPADGPSGFQGKIQQALEAGYSPDEVKQYLLGREDFAGKLEQARQAGYSDDEIWQYLGFGDKPKAGQPGEPYRVKITLHEGEQPATGQASHGGIVGGIQQGLRDPIDAGAQMLRRIVPDSVGNAVDALGNKLAELGLPIAPSTGVAGVDSLVNQSNAQYEADRAAAGRSGIDFARIGGDLLGTAPMLGGGLLARGATLPARVGIGAAQGGAAGLLSPVVGADNQAKFGDVKGQQGLLRA